MAEDKRSYTVTKLLSGAGEQVVIPSHHEGLPVAAIGDAVFRGKTDLVSVEIPDTIKRIGAYAFSDCTALTSITMPHSVEKTGTGAFEGCTALASVRFSERFETLGVRTFAGCTALSEVTLPNSLTKIGGSAFLDCVGLTSITLPRYLEEIGPRAFGGCTGLETIDIPDFVTKIEEYAFENCEKLSVVTIGEKTTLWSLGTGAFSGTAVQNLTLPKKMGALYGGAFSGMKKLQSLTFSGAELIGRSIMEETPITTLTFTGKVEEFQAMHEKNADWYLNSLGNVTHVICSDGTFLIPFAE